MDIMAVIQVLLFAAVITATVSDVPPEAYMNVTQLLRSKGYPCEEHNVTTQDGFILSLQRVTHGRNNTNVGDKPVILLQHGLLSCSACFAENLVNESLAYILADNDIEVWLGNNRGNTYSNKHLKFKPTDEEYWAWSWDEMAKYDLSAMIDHILTVTNKSQIYFVGYSQGSIIGFAAFSENQTLASKIKLFINLAPLTTLGNVKSPIRLLKNANLFQLFGRRDFLPSSSLVRWFGREMCGNEVLNKDICENIFFILGGYDSKQLNASRVPVYTAHEPAGTSVQNMQHYMQGMKSNKFQKYDYGSTDENMKHYNQTTPPLYNVTAMTTPVMLYSGTADWLADPTDTKALIPQIQHVLGFKNITGWEHLDFIWAMNSPDQCYYDMVSRIKELEEKH